MTLAIALTQGHVAMIDDEDAHLANQKWFASVRGGGRVYAFDGKEYLHRKVLGLKRGGPLVDHINGDGLDCRRENLRVATHKINGRNVAGRQTNNKSGFLGVHRDGSKFEARIWIDGKSRYLGRFSTVEEANDARLAAESNLWGIQPRRACAHEQNKGESDNA
jgi:hypothetical protein